MNPKFAFRSLLALGICIICVLKNPDLLPPTKISVATAAASLVSQTSLNQLPETRHLTVFNDPLLTGAIKKVMPVPPTWINAKGWVKARITFNTSGEIEEAEILTGHPLLRNSVIEAARQWRFKPTIIDGVPIKIHGVLAFKFSTDENGVPVVVAEAPPIPAGLRQIWMKLHPSVSAVIERINAKSQATANESTFIRNGNANLLVRLTEKSQTAMAHLKNLGFEIAQNPANSELVSGRLPIEKLEALANLASVQYVLPLSGK